MLGVDTTLCNPMSATLREISTRHRPNCSAAHQLPRFRRGFWMRQRGEGQSIINASRQQGVELAV
jgi:hypothetical protein